MRNHRVECDACGEPTTAEYCRLELPCGCFYCFCQPRHRLVFEMAWAQWAEYHECMIRDPVTGRIMGWFGDEVDDA